MTAALVLGACPVDSGGAAGGGRDSVTLSGQVYTRGEIDFGSISELGIKYDEYQGGDLIISDGGLGGTGGIKNGKLSYTIGTPAALFPIDMDMIDARGVYANISISRSGVSAAPLLLLAEDGPVNGALTRERLSVNSKAGLINFSGETVTYIYVDNNVTITAKGDAFTDSYGGIPYSVATQDIRLNMKKGWNAVNIKLSINLTMNLISGAFEPAGIISASLGDSSAFRWTLNSGQELTSF